ncbi:MAG: DUF1194 domain-containing protein [Pseudomonadota bacterium]
MTNRLRKLCMLLTALIWSAIPIPAHADPIAVDAELVLAVDVSRSMSPAELEIQRLGYAEALASAEVIDAIQNGLLGRVAIQYVEWAGQYNQRIVVDWALVESRADAQAFAEKLLQHTSPSMSRTSISGGINFAVHAIENNAFSGNRRIIDMSGDGPNNQGPYVVRARDEALAKGIVINGLPLMTRDGVYSQFDIERLDLYYRACVIGGPGAFLIPVLSWDELPQAVRRKLILELAGRTPDNDPVNVIRTNASILDLPATEQDCRIGEKIWEQNRWMWSDP